MRCIQCGHWEEKLSIEQIAKNSLHKEDRNFWMVERDTYEEEVYYCNIVNLFINSNGIINIEEDCIGFISKLEYHMRRVIDGQNSKD